MAKLKYIGIKWGYVGIIDKKMESTGIIAIIGGDMGIIGGIVMPKINPDVL